MTNRPQVGPDNSDVTKVKFISIPFSFVKSWDKKGSSFSIFFLEILVPGALIEVHISSLVGLLSRGSG